VPSPLQVSVLITTYNRPQMLARLLASVAPQTYRHFEVLVVDDYSSDPAALNRAVEPFRKKFREFRLLRNDRNRGAPFSRNRGIRAAKYPLIALADDDDEWMPDKLRRQTEVFRKNWEGTDMVYVWFVLKNHRKGSTETRRSLIRGVALREMMRNCFFPPSALMVKRERLLEAGLFDESLSNAQDWDMWIRLFKKGCSCEPVPAPLVLYHAHTESITYSKSFGFLIVLFKHFPAFLRYNPLGIFEIFVEIGRRNVGKIRRALESRLASVR
jgi:GT2 family glycosyltransferase